MFTKEESRKIRLLLTDQGATNSLAKEVFAPLAATSPRSLPVRKMEVGGLTVEWHVAAKDHDIHIRWMKGGHFYFPVQGYVTTAAMPDPTSASLGELGMRIEHSAQQAGQLSHRMTKGSDHFFTFFVLEERRSAPILAWFRSSSDAFRLDAVCFKERLIDLQPEIIDLKEATMLQCARNDFNKALQGDKRKIDIAREKAADVVARSADFQRVSEAVTTQYHLTLRSIDGRSDLSEKERQELKQQCAAQHQRTIQELNQVYFA